MPLSVLVVVVVVGIAGIALATLAAGFSARRTFADADAALAAWAREYPTCPARSATLCSDGTAALIDTVQGPGLVWAMGADSAARLLTGARVTRRKGGLRIDLPDYAAPRISLALTPDEAAAWTARLCPAKETA